MPYNESKEFIPQIKKLFRLVESLYAALKDLIIRVVVLEAAPTPSLFVNVTYAELGTLITNSQLEIGKKYVITDHKTKYAQPVSGVIMEGTLEPLIVTAIAANEFSVGTYSPLFPNDIIHYNFTDDSCEDGIWSTELQRYTGGTSRKGKIFYRKDTINNLETYYDWRNVKFRRWVLDATEWVSGQAYTQYDVVKSPITNHLYVAINDITDVNDPSVDTVNWFYFMYEGTFISWTNVSTDFYIGPMNADNFIINDALPGVDYEDYFTFGLLDELNNSSGQSTGANIGEGMKNISIGRIDKEGVNDHYGHDDISYNNIIIIVNSANLLNMFSNIFGDNNFNMTIRSDPFYNNSFGPYSCMNCLINEFSNNTINNYFEGNFIRNPFAMNDISNCFYYNYVNNFYDNIVAKDFQSNIIINTFSANNVDYEMQGNIIISMLYNNIGYHFRDNKIGENFKHNIIGNMFQRNVILDNFSNNITTTGAADTLDFTLATHVYTNYSCTLFFDADMVSKLSYISALGVLTVVASTD